MEKAKTIYKSDMKDKTFEFDHYWHLLNQCPKWHSDPSFDIAPIRPMVGQSSSFIDLDDQSLPVEGTPISWLSRPDECDKQRAQNRGKAMDNYAEDREEQRQKLLARGAHLEERCNNKTLHENYKMERERRKWKEEDENALQRRRDKEFDYRERETALYENDIAILDADQSKLTPRKRKIVQPAVVEPRAPSGAIRHHLAVNCFYIPMYNRKVNSPIRNLDTTLSNS
ncbi:hypothetical protein LINGRAHAP2_LOCUS23947 [Linum grandiflorum]